MKKKKKIRFKEIYGKKYVRTRISTSARTVSVCTCVCALYMQYSTVVRYTRHSIV
jgi:hypothetical protein